MPRYGESAPTSGLYGHKENMEPYMARMRFAWGFADGVRDEKKGAEIPDKLSDPTSTAYDAAYYAGREHVQDGKGDDAVGANDLDAIFETTMGKAAS